MHTTEYFSALKKKEILTYATTWVNLEDIKLSEINQTPIRTASEVIPLMIPLI